MSHERSNDSMHYRQNLQCCNKYNVFHDLNCEMLIADYNQIKQIRNVNLNCRIGMSKVFLLCFSFIVPPVTEFIIIKKVLIKVTLNAKALQGHCTHENNKVHWSNVEDEQ